MLDLYKNIKRLRKERDLSQDELAKLCGYTSRSSVNKIEQGLVDISISKVEAFANALGVEPNELMGDSWESNILDNARLDLVQAFRGDAFKIAKFEEAEKEDAQREAALAYYLNPDAEKVAKEMFERPELRVLFDASRNVDKDDIIQVSKILEKLQRLEDGNGDD